MIPLALVAGFLGSGKTTFLRRLSSRNDGRRLAFLVNDFAAIDVDAQLLSELDGEIISIPGGSIFCRCLATTFTNSLRKIACLQPPVDGVIIEASGMADPRSLADMLRDTRLDREFELSTVVSLADPGTFRKLIKTLPAMSAQIECADVVLLNKTDLYDEATLQQTEAAIRAIRADVPVLRCVRGEAPVEFFKGVSHACKIHAEPTACRDESFLSATFRFPRENGHSCPFDSHARQTDKNVRSPLLSAVASLLACHARILWRAKGFVPTTEGLVELHWTMRPENQGHIETHPAANPKAQAALVLIARGDAERELDGLVESLKKIQHRVQ